MFEPFWIFDHFTWWWHGGDVEDRDDIEGVLKTVTTVMIVMVMLGFH